MSGSIEATIKFSIVPEAVADHSILGLSANAVRLYAILDRYGNSEGAIACPSRRTLARRCGFSTDTVDRAKAELVNAGLLEEVERFGDSGAAHNPEFERSSAGNGPGTKKAVCRQPGRPLDSVAKRPCFPCRTGLHSVAPFAFRCSCDHEHDVTWPKNAVAGRAAIVATCSVCGLVTAVDDVDGGD